MNDILEVTRGIIVHQVNAQGVMGGGVAKLIREKWPQVFADYIGSIGYPYTQKENGRHFLGSVIWTKVNNQLWIASAVGQQFFGRDEKKRYTSYDALDSALEKIAMFAKMHDLPVFYPRIGAGLGNGNWDIIKKILDVRLTEVQSQYVEPPAE